MRLGGPRSAYPGEFKLCLAGPAGTGKSRSCLEKVHACCVKYPYARWLIARQTRASLTDTILPIFEQWVLPPGSPIARGPARQNRHSYKYPNGSEIVLGGFEDARQDQEASKHLSSEYDGIYIPELIEVSEGDFENIGSRLRARAMGYRVMIGDTNPGPPTHWILEAAEAGRLRLLETHHEDNPIYYDRKTGEWTELGKEYVFGNLAKMQGHRRERMFLGKWVQPEGSRWPELEDRIHRFDSADLWPFGLPGTFTKRITIDWGIAAPFCALWLAFDQEANVYVYRELYKPGLPTAKQAELIVNSTGSNEVFNDQYADPACWNHRRDQEGRPQKSDAEYYQEAFDADNAKRRTRGEPHRFGPLCQGNIGPGDRCHALSTLETLINRGNGYPNLFIDRRCVSLWKELTGAIWAKNGAENIDPSCPDHAITALYYGTHATYDLPKPTVQLLPSANELRQKQAEEERRRVLRDFYNRQTRNFRI